MPGPLTGVRVLDLTQAVSGPYATLLMADLGAEVIKIEPFKGDQAREIPSPMVGDQGSYFVAMNRQKRSIRLNLKSETGREIFYDCVRKSDVVFDNFRPGVRERLQIDYQTLAGINPRIISCSLSAYGATGPYKNKPGYDLIIQALGGGMSLTGNPGEPPVRMGLPIGDLGGGMCSITGILAALYEREKSGIGQHIDTSLLDGQISLLAYQLTDYHTSLEIPKPHGTGHPSASVYRMFETKEGYIVVVAHREHFFLGLVEAMELPELAIDERFNHPIGRRDHRKELESILEKVFLEKTAVEWRKILDKMDVPCATVSTLDQVMEDEQVLARKMIVDVDATYGSYKAPGNPIKMSRTNEERVFPAPFLGEYSEEFLKNVLGYSQEQIDNLIDKEII
ncbi:CaiB/BaiF CoA-transferase family protein [Neobacillus niacini]|uniref:CaiB/BaiF CoA transferase family protein n=1 Tax=Neobacillus niacini TaxID=86668 RepID=UPI0021CB81D8|nr:CoA transferase [Neobacillus niacini]MCM3766207.1 CoA transferase [Neobacillus niacini]